MHELPQLGKLERKYRDELVVIGVQSPKYPAEGTGDSLIRAVERYEITHPVVNDPDSRVWNDYAVKAWPTLVFVSPTGSVIGSHAGEAPFDALDTVVGQVVAEYEREGSLARGRGPEGRPFSRPAGELSFPGKVLAAGGRLFIADSGHHRLLVCDLEGMVMESFGSGDVGMVDGDRGVARFNRPQGMALDPAGEALYIADSENHAIRAVHLVNGQVSTVAGTGEQARQVTRGGPAAVTPISSPWDLVLRDNTLYIAMAGLHQVWALDLGTQTIGVWAGTGHEGIRDGSRTTAWLAQPMGVAASDENLFIACAEAQAVRAVNFSREDVSTIAGRGLFDFGDEDGPGAVASMQHPQGIAYHRDNVYLADTYNNKIKRMGLGDRTVMTVAGSGQTGTLDGPGANARLNEPAGISALANDLYIADTNNHSIRRLDLDSGHINTVPIRWS